MPTGSPWTPQWTARGRGVPVGAEVAQRVVVGGREKVVVTSTVAVETGTWVISMGRKVLVGERVEEGEKVVLRKGVTVGMAEERVKRTVERAEDEVVVMSSSQGVEVEAAAYVEVALA